MFSKKTLIIPFSLFVFISTSIQCAHKEEKPDKVLVQQVLNLLHQSASEANGKLYFSLFHKNAVFIGTDPNETWSLNAFRVFAQPYFSKGAGWTYRSRDRHIYFSDSNQTAWFDEMLDNDQYGETRGTGVLVKTTAGWKITQYHLTIPIPNELASDITQQIKEKAISPKNQN